MIRMLDGPAQGVALELKNAPEVLRVVKAADGTWDALDAPGDFPRPDEHVYLYRRHGSPGVAMIDYVDRVTGRRRGKSVMIAQYRFIEAEP
jgi:hypothetical protein